jgi:hypothetical protein
VSRFTREDAIAARLMPAVRASRPVSQMRQQRAVQHAITDDGRIKSEALLLSSNLIINDDASSATLANASTTDDLVYIEEMFSLPSGVWRVSLKGAVTASLSGVSNLNSTAVINGDASSNRQIPIAAADRLATVFSRHSITGVPGGQVVTVQITFRPSAGTATAESGYYEYRAERTA